MRTAIIRSALTLCATAPLIALSAPVSLGAARAEADCPQQALCLWTKPNYRGQRLVVQAEGVSNKIFRQLNDQASSLKIRWPGAYVTLFSDINGEGDSLCFVPGNERRVRDLGDYSGGFYNNVISSSEISDGPTSRCF